MDKKVKLNLAIRLAWCIWGIHLIVGVLVAGANLDGSIYFYGSGFLMLSCVSICCKIGMWRLDNSLPFPYFYILALMVPGGIGIIFLTDSEEFYHLVVFIGLFLLWIILFMIHCFHVYIYRSSQPKIYPTDVGSFSGLKDFNTKF